MTTKNPTTPPGRHAQNAQPDPQPPEGFLEPLLQSGFRILDVGCSHPETTLHLAEAVLPGRVTAFAHAPDDLARLRRLAEGREIVNINFVGGTLTALPFAEGTFDIVHAHRLLEQTRDARGVIAEFRRVTRPGGFPALSCLDDEATEITPFATKVGRAFSAYRDTLRGINSRAGAQLQDWLQANGLTPLTFGEWHEDHPPQAVARTCASRLDEVGQFHHATTLREWATRPESRYRQAWKYATAIRADDHPHRGRIVE